MKVNRFTLLLILLCLGQCSWASSPTPPKGIIPLPGKLAPDLMLKDMDERPFDLKASRGQWLFVHFWASWCGPCREEMPTIQRLSKLIDPKKLKIVLVNTAENDDAVFSFIGIAAPDLATLMDRDGLVTEMWQPRGLPSTYLVDPQGKLRFVALGGRPWDKKEYVDFLIQLSLHPL